MAEATRTAHACTDVTILMKDRRKVMLLDAHVSVCLLKNQYIGTGIALVALHSNAPYARDMRQHFGHVLAVTPYILGEYRLCML